MIYTLEDIKRYKDAYEILTDNSNESLSSELISNLAYTWRTRFVGFTKITQVEYINDSIRSLIKYRDYPQECMCIGSYGVFPWCSCIKWQMIEKYRYDIAYEILNTHTEFTSPDDMLKMAQAIK